VWVSVAYDIDRIMGGLSDADAAVRLSAAAALEDALREELEQGRDEWDGLVSAVLPGLIEAIGDWVVDEVAARQRAWRDTGLDLEVSFNLSPRQLWTPRLADRLIGKMRDAGVEPASLQAEITESTAMADPDRTQRILRDLHSWGLRLAIDDFGTGYSSLARLKHMPVDVLKIDREFVRNVDKDVRLAGMVRAMIQVAQSLDMVPLAEGVETEGEYVFLRSNGCRLAQGFWFSHPVPVEEIPGLASKASLIPGREDRHHGSR
jgi:EAL domain-containing protein (putative c-di-GMP-specific phosphodiesterase class I)